MSQTGCGADGPSVAPGASDEQKFPYTNYFREVNVMAALQLMPDEIPWLTKVPDTPEPYDTVLFLGCNALKTPHIVQAALAISRTLTPRCVAIGGPANCCGILHHMNGDLQQADRIAESSTSKVASFRPTNVVTICPNCNYYFENVVSRQHEVPFEMMQFYEFVHPRVSQLAITRPYPKRVGLHRHVGSSHHQDRHGDVCAEILRAIPGLELVELPSFPDLGPLCTARAARNLSDARYAEVLDELFAAAAREACDVLATIYHSCQRELCGEEARGPVEVKSVITILAEALGFEFEDKLKRFKKIGNVDVVLEEVAPYVKAHRLSPQVARTVLASVIG